MSDIDIKKIVHEELNILVDLFYYMEKLKNGILNNDEIKSLNFVVSKISENALNLSKIEKQRIEIFNNFASQMALKNTLKDFIKYFDKKDKEIAKILKEISEKLMDISSLNSTLKELLKARIEYNDILIKLFMGSENTVPVYNKNGIYNKTIDQSKANWQG
ncbi:FlgN protein [Marinitoga hydrogenitolerans DSM 16785]|uniref:FlgN protein n=1 Tax=Marinitoga hydrogenitolerans (strain DSM 16785 / JCM 12826 / AT1271) TaxID=1122195 RepID=A0A1M4V3I9_MARH1|nr:flagellar export chaperone FlgN [Marinitoga hydrogenitolerans]SHE63470.1 FlgN protein [Marinitoga hydrogenitolerans DSM 16785]